MLNGEVTTYKLNKPVKWATFKKWPGDIRREYIIGLQNKYGASSSMLYKMFGVSQGTYFKEMQRLNIVSGLKPPKEKAAWEAFLATAEPEPEETEKPNASAPIVRMDKDGISFAPSFDPVVEMIRSLRGTGAKITIEVTL